MKLVAVVKPVAAPDAAARTLAEAAGLALAEARMRLAPEPPALVARVEDSAAASLVAALRRAGLAALAVDARVPTDEDRTVARAFAIDDAAATFTPRVGPPAVFRWGELLAVLRGARAARADVARTEKTRRLSFAATAASGGVPITRASTTTVRSSEEAIEQVILVYARDGRAAALAEGDLEFSCLGAAMQPTSTGNMAELARQLRDRARGAYHDDRLLRLGRRPLPFVAGGEARSQTRTTTTVRTDTRGALDTLAEVMRQAVAGGLLP